MMTVRGEPDQVPRKLAYQTAHPDVQINYHGAFWEAVIPEPAGQVVVVRYELRDLLDRLDELTAG